MSSIYYLHTKYVDDETGFTCTYIRNNFKNFRLHRHDYFEVFLTLSPDIIHLINGKQIILREGTLAFIRPEDEHTYAFSGNNKFDVINIAFTHETVNSLFNYLSPSINLNRLLSAKMPPFVILSKSGKDDLSHQMLRLNELYLSNKKYKEDIKLFARYLLVKIFTEYLLTQERILKVFGNEGFSDGAANKHESEQTPYWLKNLYKQMELKENFSAGFEKMASISRRTPEHISRCFRKYLDTTPTDYINELRLNYTANMLACSNIPIIDLCFESGFGNIPWFYRLFREKYGTSPKKFRENYKTEMPF